MTPQVLTQSLPFKARLFVALALAVVAAVFAGSANASPLQSYPGTLSCVYQPATTSSEMIEQAPWVKAADSTPYVDHQRIWLEVVFYQYQRSWDSALSLSGQWVAATDPSPLWLYTDATDTGYTNQWHLSTNGGLDNGTFDGITNAIAHQNVLNSGESTFANYVYVPNGSGGYSLAKSFWLLPGTGTGSESGVPTC